MAKILTKSELEQIQSYPIGLSPEKLKEKYGLNIIRKMSDNENIYGCSQKVKDAMKEQLNSLHLYPDGHTSALIRRLAKFYQIKEDQLLAGNGSDELIRLLTRAYINKGDEAIMADITFPRYETNVVIEGGKAIKVPLINGVHHLPSMLENITAKTKMIFICNPNNPTGTIVGKEELAEFIKKVPAHILMVLDEAYYEYVTSDQYLHSIPLLESHPNLVILRTFSKIYGLAGLRVGYGMMNKQIVKELHKVKDVFNVNQVAQVAAIYALEDQDFIRDCAEKNAVERAYVCEQLRKFGLPFFHSQTNFIYVYSQIPVTEQLITKGFLVRQMKLNGYADAFRMTFGNRKDNEAFVEALSKI
ncbi:histidinol-phosphate transaminase [Cytobacillus depressus]|uniref:Histidinol-phosphate aminotransferase n=1 Tax=Cytobacillus depressus TaxID=1602942 RepID=A0A6L3UZE6_9BACI|nr:histidinol-phosphate transaminase [Cytobacillus depressus]KAB2329786.1 histidinol-phosphate transaminase [Cytobacillus depressus]